MAEHLLDDPVMDTSLVDDRHDRPSQAERHRLLLARVCIQATHDLIHLPLSGRLDLNPGEVGHLAPRLARTSPQLPDDRWRGDDVSYVAQRFDVPQAVEGDRDAGIERQDGTGRARRQATLPGP